MLLRSILASGSGLFAATTLAFQDTSPFFAFSTSNTLKIPSRQVATSDQLLGSVRTNEIEADVYIVVSQPGVSADDFENADTAPHMRQRLTGYDDAIQSKAIVPEIIGGMKAIEVEANLPLKPASRTTMDRVYATIGSNGLSFKPAEYPYVLYIDLPNLPTSGERRTQLLAEHDTHINIAFTSLANAGASVTLLYTSTPPSAAVYASQRSHSEPLLEKTSFDWEAEHANLDALHIDLKRDMAGHMRKRANVTLNEGAPLFEKYNFFSPGIFMGILVMLILFSIGSVGVKALGGLQVSYAAFSKENGPQAQKKGQQ